MSIPFRSGQYDAIASTPMLPPPVQPPVIEVPYGAATGRVEPLFDLKKLQEIAGFPWRSVKRHRALSSLIVIGTMTLAVLAAIFLPRTYQVESRILAQRNYVMPALGNPRRAVPTESDAPTRLAAEAVMSRENLVQIIRDAHLLEQWSAIRSPLGRLKERVFALAGRKTATNADKVDMLVEVLEQKLWVTTGDGADGTVTIGVNWPEPRSALQIVEAAQQNFLEQRHASEVARIEESIAILEQHVDTAQAAVTGAISALGSSSRTTAVIASTQSTRRAREGAATSRSESASGSGTTHDLFGTERSEIQRALTTKQQLLQDLESARSRRVADLQTQLADLQRRYGSAHPEVVAVHQSIDALSQDSPQIASLRAELQTLGQRLLTLGAPPAPRPTLRGTTPTTSEVSDASTPHTAYTESKLKIAIADYEDLLDRLESARIELETARAAFKYRYSVITPPELPKRAIKPKPLLLVVGGMFMAVCLTVFASVVLDLLSGKALEAWQLEKALGLPVIGRVRAP